MVYGLKRNFVFFTLLREKEDIFKHLGSVTKQTDHVMRKRKKSERKNPRLFVVLNKKIDSPKFGHPLIISTARSLSPRLNSHPFLP